MTVVYLDSLFLLNWGVDSVLLTAAAKLGGASRRHWRILFAAALGALYTVIVFCLPCPYASHPLWKGVAAAGMVLLAVGREQRPLRVFVLFLLLSCSLAGGVLLLEAAGIGQMSNSTGFPMTLTDGKLLLLCGAGEYLAASLLSRLPMAASGKLLPVLVACQGRQVFFHVLVDSGNQLKDPVTGASVLVASWRAVLPLFPKGCAPTQEELRHPAACLQALSCRWQSARLGLVPYRAVGTEQGLLLTLRGDKVVIDGKAAPSTLIAITPVELSKDYQGLIGLD